MDCRSPGSTSVGRVALVTGAASGIGRAACVALAAGGAHVLACSYAGDEHDVGATVAAAGAGAAAGAEVRPFAADVRDGAQLEAACAEARRRWGRFDVVVASAAVLSGSSLAEMTDETWNALLDVDLGGVMRTVRAAAAALGEGGAIVCVSSTVGNDSGWPGHSHYATAKAGIMGLVRSAALELADRGIRVNAVLPGVIDTPQSHASVARMGVPLAAVAERVPLGRVGAASDVAAAIAFLASADASYVTGQGLVVDGGLAVKLPL
ncbi:MAG TPA: SDR family oxidoreductase [Conexibacter sp.]|jgi:3-oxoacyl-[acyl-carrier protein] reductase|nr:SDR family oxidoreductase [Conexibacter sp.]